MALLGPVADPEAWRHHAMSAVRGRLCKCIQRGSLCPSLFGKVCPDEAYLDDNRDEPVPLLVLGTWEQIWRDHLDHPTEQPLTVASASAYLGVQLAYMADQPEPAFEEFARELRACRGHLEDVLRDGMRDEHGAPCVQCERPMVRLVTDQGAQDVYRCHGCRREVSGDQYHWAVGAAYRAHAPALTVDDLILQYGVTRGSVTGWASKGEVKRRGKNLAGRVLYDVADVLRMRDARVA